MLAQMAGAVRRARIWLASFGRRPLALTSPYPVAECLQRLAAVTTSRGRTTWYLDPRTATRPDPLFKGELYPSRTRLSRFADGGGRGRSVVWLEVRLDPRAGGGTAFSGWIGRPAGAFEASVLIVIGVLVCLGLLVAGVVLLAGGHFIGLAPALASPLPAAFFVWSFAFDHRELDASIAGLIHEVDGVLGTAGTP